MSAKVEPKNRDINTIVITVLIVIAVLLTAFLAYKFTHHSTDNFAIPSHQNTATKAIKS